MILNRVLPLALLVVGPSSLLAQTPASLASKSTIAAETPANIYAVDLNNDGITDILQDAGLSSPGFTVSLGNGDGTFKPPVHYSLPAKSLIGTEPLATGDFNNDGKVDVAAVLSNGNQVAVFLGDGDGTFQSPKISTIGLPSGWNFSSGGAAAADFNADGKVDLVAWTTNYINSSMPATTSLYVLEGNGTGAFTNPHIVLTGPAPQPDFQVFVGDYDSDGKADIVVNPYIMDPRTGNTTSTTVHVLYGKNDFTFTDTTPYTAMGPLFIGSGDLNSDGFTDVYGMDGGFSVNSRLAVLYGHASRTFSSYFMPLNSNYPLGAASDSSDLYTPQFTLGDFNGDGLMDLAAMGWNASYNQAYVEVFLATTSPGQFTIQPVQLATTYKEFSTPIVGLFGNNHLTPDIAFNQSPNFGGPPQDKPSYLVTELNQANSGWFGPCYYPKSGQGFNVCTPGTVSGSTVTFNAAVNSFGKLRKIELWVDGKKISEQHHAWDHHAYFFFNSTFAAGSHSATFFAGDVDNRLQRYDMTFTIGGSSCSAPSSPSVHVCSPANYSTVNSPVQALATATITGSLARMEIWVDGVKKYTETTSLTVNIPLTLAAGQHKIDFYAANTAGTLWGTTAHATVP